MRDARTPGTSGVLRGHARRAIGVRYEEFAKRAGRRLEATAYRLEGEGRRLGIDGGASKIAARARELRVAALLVHEEAVGREEREAPKEKIAENLSLEAQG